VLQINPDIPFWALALERKWGTTQGKVKLIDIHIYDF